MQLTLMSIFEKNVGKACEAGSYHEMRAKLRRALQALYTMWSEEDNVDAYILSHILYAPYAAFRETLNYIYYPGIEKNLDEASKDICEIFQEALTHMPNIDYKRLEKLALQSMKLAKNLLETLEAIGEEEEE